MASSYRIIYRFDAESALKATREEEPSLILSDVVMPGMSGYDLCKEIKQDIQLCHIPVILVTAKTTTENQVEGLNSGADAYVTKPFTPKVLLAMINSQLTNREKTKTILTNATETDKIRPVMIFGKAIGSTTRRMVCNFVAPKARLPCRNESSILFRASSVVRIIRGSDINASVNEPAMIESPQPSALTNSDIPNKPNTTDGTPLRLFVMIRMKRTTLPFVAYSFM